MIFRKKSGPIDLLIVGLGNPGKTYENTRHNAGAIALSALADKCGVSLTRSKFHALTAEATVSAGIGSSTEIFRWLRQLKR